MTELTLFLAGDVMTGRGIDQALPHPVEPVLYEPWVKDAREYIALAERAGGTISRPVDFAYIWGDALVELARAAPAARIINLETAVTTHPRSWPGKGIQYRMNPANLPALTTAGVDCCVLANNHVLDWSRERLRETLAVLHRTGIATAGAGVDAAEAAQPAVLHTGAGRLLVHAFGEPNSGILDAWAADAQSPGVNLLPNLSETSADRVAEQCRRFRRPGDRVVVSLHWGGNWGHMVPDEQVAFAHHLIDAGAADVVHGHSSHHPKAIEVYRSRLVLYGCGDLLNDYEGIGGHREYRGDLTMLYLPRLDSEGKLLALRMVPKRIQHFRLNRPQPEETAWLHQTLDRHANRFDAAVALKPDGSLELRWG